MDVEATIQTTLSREECMKIANATRALAGPLKKYLSESFTIGADELASAVAYYMTLEMLDVQFDVQEGMVDRIEMVKAYVALIVATSNVGRAAGCQVVQNTDYVVFGRPGIGHIEARSYVRKPETAETDDELFDQMKSEMEADRERMASEIEAALKPLTEMDDSHGKQDAFQDAETGTQADVPCDESRGG